MKIDAALTSLLDGFGAIVRSLKPQHICSLSDHDMILRQTYPGIYRIDVKVNKPIRDGAALSRWKRRFAGEWDHADFVGKNTPTTKIRRMAAHVELLDWMPVYIAKTKNIARRVAEHMDLALGRRTVAMKLRSRPMWNEREFRLSTIHLPVTHDELIAPRVEAELREHVNPLVGRQ